jgi:hypothetical protein
MNEKDLNELKAIVKDTRIDCALHHTEKYPMPDFGDRFNGNAESVYTALCLIREKWNKLFEQKKVNTTHAFVIFSQWVDQVYKYAEYLSNKYRLGLRTMQITSIININGRCYWEEAKILYNRKLLQQPEQTLRTIIHELCHLKYWDHKKDFWQFYEDICINEGVLLERVLSNNGRFEDIKENIPYRWTLKSPPYVLSEREEKVINKFLRRTLFFRRSCITD